MRSSCKLTPTLLALAATALAAANAHADPGRSYALVVGSNPGGAGQTTLQYAERDAENVAALLGDIGGYQPADVTLLTRPTPAALLAAIDRIGDRIKADAAAGRQSVLFFYYSGHARSAALNLGSAELALAELRERLLGLPATLKIVVLDACQSGAFSNVKGIEPAADFSHNSIARLNSAGTAVMASSSATELSQESDKLGGSYFTHHLMVGLRGAGDVDADGQVSLDEAYRYAYDRTLVDTAKTAVGRQHVTLETDLRGKGDVPLTYPARADAHLRLPHSLTAEVLIQTRKTGAVVAEVHKARGAMKLAMASGSYRVLVIEDGRARQCDVALPPGRAVDLDPAGCPRITLTDDTSKGGTAAVGQRWTVEAGFAAPLATVGDRYLERLNDFGYEEGFHIELHYSLTGIYRLSRHLAIAANLAKLDSGYYYRDDDTQSNSFEWATYGLALLARGEYPVVRDWLIPYAEAGAGVARGSNRLQIGDRPATHEVHWGYQLAVAAGVRLQPWRHLGFYSRVTGTHAPVMDNLLGDTHDSGGIQLSTGLAGSF